MREVENHCCCPKSLTEPSLIRSLLQHHAIHQSHSRSNQPVDLMELEPSQSLPIVELKEMELNSHAAVFDWAWKHGDFGWEQELVVADDAEELVETVEKATAVDAEHS
jgi:hypothetical protein